MWLTYVVNDWIDKYPQIYKWRGYPDEETDKMVGCMLRRSNTQLEENRQLFRLMI